ncbi:hypothetical protein BU24DRAFT_74201 [Aaosphaeria arxii CBS 175.79]|uniref:Uncharacterized protein n=1 Tax=Aaosphaeria arxii CBS 175.79 TaxID=1450172 RepID=A0A6A5X8Z7_9PLEO|nr:uncharacterized protein BU24DRAFT_74201 [Aaosphaeria arxii CBS 175.79]KAF2009380.1 hypothetical protein BU24DRAFT_74201 [Aaosphaeria arxii CBS 175.79]
MSNVCMYGCIVSLADRLCHKNISPDRHIHMYCSCSLHAVEHMHTYVHSYLHMCIYVCTHNTSTSTQESHHPYHPKSLVSKHTNSRRSALSGTYLMYPYRIANNGNPKPRHDHQPDLPRLSHAHVFSLPRSPPPLRSLCQPRTPRATPLIPTPTLLPLPFAFHCPAVMQIQISLPKSFSMIFPSRKKDKRLLLI